MFFSFQSLHELFKIIPKQTSKFDKIDKRMQKKNVRVIYQKIDTKTGWNCLLVTMFYDVEQLQVSVLEHSVYHLH
jgi:hypothetical protein